MRQHPLALVMVLMAVAVSLPPLIQAMLSREVSGRGRGR